MNYTIKVDGKVYDVKILDLQSIPIKVIVDGTEVEVWPEEKLGGREAAPILAQPSAGAPSAPAVSSPTPSGAGPATANGNDQAVKAPLPGVVISIKVKVGDSVEIGQELITIEAMKMKNIIRAIRPGKIATIAVSIGETVQHQDLLLEYES